MANWLSKWLPTSIGEPQPTRQTTHVVMSSPLVDLMPGSSVPSSLTGPKPKQFVGPRYSQPNSPSSGGIQDLGAAYPFKGGIPATGQIMRVGSHWYSGSPTGVGGGYYGRV